MDSKDKTGIILYVYKNIVQNQSLLIYNVIN